ncbi:MAG: ATP-binding cassette domain-containing protein [Paracoccus sp. (in: a-proteobacteria)]|nr:ATP-binding cassette domain-containing protein [Paracoccus sp. (in: a-proteobacteria)]
MSIEIRNLGLSYAAGIFGKGRANRALDGVNLSIPRGCTMGIVGESGSGKSTLGRVLLRILQPCEGQVLIEGQDPWALPSRAMPEFRRSIQAVFQDSGASLNPRQNIGATIREGLDIHGIGTPASRKDRVPELLAQVGLEPAYAARMPHTLSGGQRQRVNIARALALRPRILVADEPVSALDTSVQSQVLELLADLKRETGMTMIFISHDLAVVREICDRVAIMHGGKLVEEGEINLVFDHPCHAVTRALIRDMPRLDLVHPQYTHTDLLVTSG